MIIQTKYFLVKMIFILCYIIIGMPLLIYAQSKNARKLTGVVSSKSGVLEGVTVVVKGTRIGTVTDVNGKYVLNGVPPDAVLCFSFMGYQSKEIDTKRMNYIHVKLEERAEDLDEVILRDKTVAGKLASTGFATNIIETGATALQSMTPNELLDQSAGVRVRQTGGLGSGVVYNINGLSGGSIRIFVDGVPMRIYGESFSLNSIPNDIIERYEVYKGVVPAHLGADALGGAINIVTKQKVGNTLSAAYSVGSFNTHQANVAGSYRDKKTGFTVQGSTFYSYSDNSYKVWGDQISYIRPDYREERITARRFHNAFESFGGQLNVGFTGLTWADKIFVGIVPAATKSQVQHGATMKTPYGNRHIKLSTAMANFSYEKKSFVKGLDVKWVAAYSVISRQTIDTMPYQYDWRGERIKFGDKFALWATGAEGGNPTLDLTKEDNYSSIANIVYKIGNNHIFNLNHTLNAFTRNFDDPLLPKIQRDLMDTRYKTKNVLGLSYKKSFLDEKLKYTIFLKYYAQNIRLKDALVEPPPRPSITPYTLDKTTNNTGYGFSFSYELLPKLTLMASAERAIRLPETYEIFGNQAENIDPSYNLLPEQSNNANIGLNVGNYDLGKEHSLGGDFNLFYRDTKEMIRQVNSSRDVTFIFENQDNVLSKGVDASLNYGYLKKLLLRFGISYIDARFNKEFDDLGQKYIWFGDRLRNQPYFTFNNNARYTFKNLFQKKSQSSVYYNIGYVHAFFQGWESLGRANKAVIPTQLVHSLGFTYTFPTIKMSLSFDVKNLSDEQVFDNWALQKPGRAYYVKLNYKIF